MNKSFLQNILLFSLHNFTPFSRTPWAGERIAQLKNLPSQRIGESWEISSHPSFPSTLTTEEGDYLLSTLIQLFPEDILGEEFIHKKGTAFPLLLKFLDAAQNLSVQVHPSDETAKHHQEAGKEEAWFIVGATEGAGVYVGLTEDACEFEVRKALKAGEDISKFLNFVSVKPGELYYIKPGTPHAVGAGVLLVESQQSSDSTFRYYDWNREPKRELHIERALEETNWETLRGKAFVESIKNVHDASIDHIQTLCAAKHFSVHSLQLKKGNNHKLPFSHLFTMATVVAGEIKVEDVLVKKGMSFLIPACLHEVSFTSRTENALLLLLQPNL